MMTSLNNSTALTINLRQKMEVFIDPAWSGSTHPAWPSTGQRLTPLQALARYETYRRAGGTWIALKAVARDGRVFDVTTLHHAIQHSRCRR